MNYATIPFKVKGWKHIQKFEPLVKRMMYVENLLRIICLELIDNGFNPWNITPYFLEKVPNKKIILDQTSKLQSLQENLYQSYKPLGYGVTQTICHKVARDIKSVLSLRQEGKYANFPKPKKLNNWYYYSCVFGKDNFRQKGCKLKIWFGTKKYKRTYTIKLPKYFSSVGKIKTFAFSWTKDVGIDIYVTYKQPNTQECSSLLKLEKNNWISIDLGMRNLISAVSNVVESFVISGNSVISYLNWIINKTGEAQKSNNLKKNRLLWKQYRTRIRNYFSLLAKQFVKFCIKKNIGTIIMGDIRDIYQKQDKHNSTTNKFFRKIPFGFFINILKNLSNVYGIDFKLVNEKDTSKLDCIFDKETTRKKSMLKTIKNYVLHADLSAAINIAKKCVSLNFDLKTLLRKVTRPKIFKTLFKLSDLFSLSKFLDSAFCRIQEVQRVHRAHDLGLQTISL